MSRHPYTISPNHLKAKPFPVAINQVWVGDIAYKPMAEGAFLSCLSGWTHASEK